jgi:hypothetical protein
MTSEMLAFDERLRFLRSLAAMWEGRRPTPPLTRLDYFREVAKRSPARSRRTGNTGNLETFRRLFMERPDDFRRRMYGANAQRLREMSPAQRDWMRILEVAPDLLAPLSLLHYEPAHSRLISFLLDPRRNEIGVALLKSFLALSHCPENVVQVEDLQDAKVTPEAQVTEGRIDIKVETSKLLAYVEVKVHAQEGPDQLMRYRKALNRHSDRVTHLVYLTLPDAPGPTRSIACEQVDFRELLRVWLPFAGAGSGGAYLARYLKSLARILGCVGQGSWNDWTFAEQRSALQFVLGQHMGGTAP